MWLSRELAAQRGREGVSAQAGTVTVDGESAAVYARGEQRSAAVVSPQGIAWRPAGGEPVVLLKGGEQEEAAYVLGIPGGGEVQVEAGELCLYSRGGAQIRLKNNGRVEITGDVFINGSKYVPMGGGGDGA